MKMKKLQGFTLIELMIVVAIIGILAAIAIPTYLDYLGRTQATEAPALLVGLKTPIVESIEINGSYPTIAQLQARNAVLTGNFVADIAIDGTGKGYIATFKSAGSVNAKLANKTITMSYATSTSEFSWSCGSLLTEVRPRVC